MSFSSNVKDDLARATTTKGCCHQAELAAYLRLNANVQWSEGEASLLLRTENAAVARKLFSMGKSLGLQTELTTHRKARLKKKQVFYLKIPPQPHLAEFFCSIGLVDTAGRWQGFAAAPEKALLQSECCKRAYLRGAFMAAGYISHPEGAYHLEISLHDMRQAILLQKLMADFEVHAKTTRRKGLIVLYLKEAEQIGLFLNVIGSHRSLLEFESARVDKEVRNQVNRLVNCDNANMDKTVTAAQKQIAQINYLATHGGLKQLSPALRETALLRLQHPDASLSDLSELSGLGRSAINHRLRRLAEIAREQGAEAAP